jgi:hypothetical protein
VLTVELKLTEYLTMGGSIYCFNELAQFIASDVVPATFDGSFLNNVNF